MLHCLVLFVANMLMCQSLHEFAPVQVHPNTLYHYSPPDHPAATSSNQPSSPAHKEEERDFQDTVETFSQGASVSAYERIRAQNIAERKMEEAQYLADIKVTSSSPGVSICHFDVSWATTETIEI